MPEIAQTSELAVAVASLIRDGLKANEDGKISIFEAAGLLAGNAGKCIAAAKGIGEIPAELKDLQEHEFEELYFVVIEELKWQDETQARAVVASVYDLVKQGFATTRAVKQYLASKAA